jgi:glycosyltransferase involved in cell wall biosynthesis
VHGLCKALAARGHEVHVFTTNVDGRGVSDVALDAPAELDGVTVHYFAAGFGRRLFRSPAMARALSRELDGFDAAHLHSVFLWPTTKSARIARECRTPYVLSPRGMLVEELIDARNRIAKRAWIAVFEKDNVAGAASVHVTADLESEHLRALRLNPRRIDVVPNGVDAPAFLERATRGRRPRRVLYLGRLSWKKRLDCLIQAMIYAPGAELVIAGFDDEGLRPRLEALAQALGLDGRVRCLGPAVGAEKWRLLADCDVFALPSRQENFGVAALEALACGRPVVAAPGVGLADAIVAAGAGLCVESEPQGLGAALAGLLDDELGCARMGDAGRELARTKYSWTSVAAQMEQVYLRAIAGNEEYSPGASSRAKRSNPA